MGTGSTRGLWTSSGNTSKRKIASGPERWRSRRGTAASPSTTVRRPRSSRTGGVAHAAYVGGKALFSGLALEAPPASWGAFFADDAKPFRFADVVHNAWRFYDWTDL